MPDHTQKCQHVDGPGSCLNCLMDADSEGLFEVEEEDDDGWFIPDFNPLDPSKERTSPLDDGGYDDGL